MSITKNARIWYVKMEFFLLLFMFKVPLTFATIQNFVRKNVMNNIFSDEVL